MSIERNQDPVLSSSPPGSLDVYRLFEHALLILLLLSGQSFPLHPPPTDSHSFPCTSLFRAPTLVKYHRRSDPLGAFRLYNHGVLLHTLRRKAPQPTSHKAVIRHRQSTDAMFKVGRSLFYTQYRAASNSCGPELGPWVGGYLLKMTF